MPYFIKKIAYLFKMTQYFRSLVEWLAKVIT